MVEMGRLGTIFAEAATKTFTHVTLSSYLLEKNLEIEQMGPNDIMQGHLDFLEYIHTTHGNQFNREETRRRLNAMSNVQLRVLTKDLLKQVAQENAAQKAMELYQTAIFKALIESKIINKLGADRIGAAQAGASVITRENINSLAQQDLLQTAAGILQVEANKLGQQLVIDEVALAKTRVGEIKAALSSMIEKSFTLNGPARAEYLAIWIHSVRTVEEKESTSATNDTQNTYVYHKLSSLMRGKVNKYVAELEYADDDAASSSASLSYDVTVTADELQRLPSSALMVALHRSGLVRTLSEDEYFDLARNKDAMCTALASKLSMDNH